MKKFRSKSKTFPQQQQQTQQELLDRFSIEPYSTNNRTYDLDVITCLSTARLSSSSQQANSSITANGSSSTELTTRSKTRASATSFDQVASAAVPVNAASKETKEKTSSPARSSLSLPEQPHQTTQLSGLMAPPSPAELLRKYSSPTGLGYVCEMDKLFRGSSVTVTQCLECETRRECPESFYDRSIPIDTNYDAMMEQEDERSGVNWISKCLSNESYLNENSKYMCEICTSQQEAKIHTQYTQVPNILILHLLSYGITSR